MAYGVALFSDIPQIINGVEVAGGVESTFTFATYGEADAFMNAASNAGFNYLYGSSGTVHFSNVIGGAGGEYGLSALNTTAVDTVGGATEVTMSGLAAEPGLNVIDGGLTWGVQAAQLGAAVVTGIGLGIHSYNSYPEFWTDLSNGLTDYMGGLNPEAISEKVIPTIVRAVEGGGIRNYVREQDINTIKHNLYNLTKMHPTYEVEDYETGLQHITVDMDHEGVNATIIKSVQISQTSGVTPPATGAGTFNRAMDYFNEQFPGHTPNYMGVASEQYEYYGQPSTGVRVKLAEVDTELMYNVQRILDSANNPYPRVSSAQALNAEVVDLYARDGSFRETLQRSTAASLDLIGGLIQQGNSAQSGGLLAHVNANPAVIYNNNVEATDEEDDFWTITPNQDWRNKGFEQTAYDPETKTVTRTLWLPLTIPQIQPNEDTEAEPENKGGTQPDPDPLIKTLSRFLPYLPWVQPPSNNEGDTPEPAAPTPVFEGSPGLWAIYNPTKAEIASLGAYLWSSNIVDIIEQFFKNSPLEAIISLHMIYATPTTGASQHIILGYLDSGVSAKTVTEQYEVIDCGSVRIGEHFGDCRDYTDTTIEIFLPFIGMRQLNTGDIVGSQAVQVIYTIDVLTGVTLAQIFITKNNVKQCLYQYEGNCSVQIPLTAADRSRLVSGMMSTVTSAVSMGAAGGPIGAVAGAIGSAVNGLSKSATIQRTGQLSGNSGAMAIKKPYIVITRKKATDIGNYYRTMGAAACYTCKLSECSGLTIVRDVRLDGLTCSASERNQIAAYLKNGIII